MDISYGKNSATLEDVKKQLAKEKEELKKKREERLAKWMETHPPKPKKSDEELIKILLSRV
jgi:hypothetical protein